ncbi:MAG: iron-containing alcohol dehydrogenase [Acidiferrobacterales bacterium]|nr:iron-containing alcohol dehydrogenase [Acidiferrobacterales bacterium]
MTYRSNSHANNWNYPTTMRFGQGRIQEISGICLEFGIKSPLLVTDPGLIDLPMVQQIFELCRSNLDNCSIFSELQPNPVESNVVQGIEVFRSGRHDGIIALGGGSALDVGKAIALMVGQTRPIWDFEDREDWYTRANADAIVPTIAIPTTSGTGSEVGRASVITDGSDQTKKIIFHPKMMPVCVILDPEVTVGLPALLTAGVGMDALSHNLEAYCSPVYHPLAQGIAVEGMRLIRDWLEPACSDGHNLEARSQMQVASSMGATAFQKGLGAMHSLSHPCGSILGTHHGTTNAVVMPYVLEFNTDAIDDRLTALARYLDLPDPSPESVIHWVLDLRNQIGIPHTLSELGMSDENVTQFSKMAMLDPSTSTNPIQMTQDYFEDLYERSISGSIGVS